MATLATAAPLGSQFEATTFEVLAKAQPDEWYLGFGRRTIPITEPQPTQRAVPKVNQDYIWGMAQSGDNLWFASSGNVHAVATTVGLPGVRWVDAVHVIEGGSSRYDGTPRLLRSIEGDWRPPQIHRYDTSTGQYENLTETNATLRDDDLLNETLGLRSAGANDEIVLFAGPNRLGTAINVFAFDAQTGEYLGSERFSDYGDIRRWVNVDGQLYTSVLKTLSPSGAGAVLRWTGTLDNPFQFEEVGQIDLEGAYIIEHEGRLFVSTWPMSDNSLMGSLGLTSNAKAGLWMSPELGSGGLTQSDAGAWKKVWSFDQYDPDPLISGSMAGGALASFDGYLYWGSMQVVGTAASAIQDAYPNDTTPVKDLYLHSMRPTCVFRGTNFDSAAGPDVELLVGDATLWTYNPGSSTPWTLVPNKLGQTPQFAAAGFGNPLNSYIWSMEVHDDVLYVGTADSSTSLATVYARNDGDTTRLTQILQSIGINGATMGGDLWAFPSGGGQATVVSDKGVGNPLNLGIRNMASTSQGLLVGTANVSNLLTETYDPPNQPLKAGGWELLRLAPIQGQDLGQAGTAGEWMAALAGLAGLDPSGDPAAIDGSLWYRVTATKAGSLTLAATPGDTGTAKLAVYEEVQSGAAPGLSLLHEGQSATAGETVTLALTAGKTYYFKVGGTSQSVDVSVTTMDNTPVVPTTSSSACDGALLRYLAVRQPVRQALAASLSPRQVAALPKVAQVAIKRVAETAKKTPVLSGVATAVKKVVPAVAQQALAALPERLASLKSVVSPILSGSIASKLGLKKR